jgi:integrase
MGDVTHLRLVSESDMGAKKRKRGHGQGSMYKRGNIWWIAFRVNGKQHSESTKTSNDEAAETLLMERLLEVGQGHGKKFSNAPKFRWVANEMMTRLEAAGELSEGTLEKTEGIINGHLLPVFGDDFFHQLEDPTIFEDYRDGKLAGKSLKTKKPWPVAGKASTLPLSAQSVNHHLTVLGTIFDFAKRRRWVTTNVIREVKRPTIHRGQPEPFEPEEVQNIMGCMDYDEDKFLALTMVALGLRIGEVLGLRLTDYKKKKGVLEVRKTIKRRKDGSFYLSNLPKRDKNLKTAESERDLKLSEFYMTALDAHIEKMERKGRIKRGTPNEFLFPNKVGNLKNPNNWRRRIWNPAVEDAGLFTPGVDHKEDRPTPHRLRHTYASEQIANNVPIPVISYRLGHANPSVTLRIYAHMFKRQAQEVADSAELYGTNAADHAEELVAA